ncbi:Prefoldin [Usnea florida]
MAEDQKKLQELSDAYQKLQTDLQATVSARQRLESQQQENKSVQKEFSLLPPTSTIYKLVGPVLLKQDRAEALMAVDARLDFIHREITRLETQIRTTQTESEGLKMEVYRLQTQMQG